MRILLSQRTNYLPARGGANRTNKLLIEELARRGHDCLVVAPALPGEDAADPASGVVRTRVEGVAAHLVTDRRRLIPQFAQDIDAFDPAVVIVSSEDFGQALLRTAIKVGRAPVVYFVQTVQALPFGPAAFFPSASATDLVRRAHAVVSISRYLSSYLQRWGGRTATLLQPPIFGDGPFASKEPLPGGYVTMVNPCELKGIRIFLALADLMPDTRFAAVPGWGTRDGDLRRLAARPNVTVLPPYDDVDDLLRQTSLVLVPSLWHETFGYVAVEAMLRGVPVVASAVGGLPEAMLGVEHCIPVHAIEEYSTEVDEGMLPIPVVPDQDIRPWVRACTRVLDDRALYARLSGESRAAALAFVRGTSWDPIEWLLLGMAAQPVTPAPSPR